MMKSSLIFLFLYITHNYKREDEKSEDEEEEAIAYPVAILEVNQSNDDELGFYLTQLTINPGVITINAAPPNEALEFPFIE